MSGPNPSATFLEEARELVQQVEDSVLALESRPDDAELINQLFRAFHTIKGSGAMFGFDAIAGFTHHVETVLQRVRDGELAFDAGLATLILGAKDHIQALLDGEGSGAPADELGALRLIGALAALCPSEPEARPALEFEPELASKAAAAIGQDAKPVAYRIFFRPHAQVFAHGMDPAGLLADLRGLGACRPTCITDAVPALEALVADRCYLAWEILLETEQGENAIRDVFIFVEDGSELRIERQLEPCSEHMMQRVEHAEIGASSTQNVANAGGAIAAADETSKPVAGKAKAALQQSTVRVPSDRLDVLVQLVGELVINQSRLSEAAGSGHAGELTAPVEAMERLIAELRDAVLCIRMMPIGGTFSRFQRLVRDLSGELGKDMQLVTEGAETELDKTMIDQLADPLVHLIRNSIDHGIEPAADRLARGKQGRGTIRLAAAHESGHVVITVEDDGRGLDPAVLRARAVEKSLIGANAVLSERECFELIFLPGFSTASAVTKVSGRGVGMDVVKRTIDALRGSISLSSRVGQGTTIRLTLPLTLAIIDGLLVEVERDRFIIPMTAVTENVDLPRHERRANNGRNLINVRGELVPYVRLREVFGAQSAEPEIEKVVVVNWEGRRLGLVVDRVAGIHQTVIQALGRFFRSAALFSGTTIMGDGRVALILDLAGIVRSVSREAAVARPAKPYVSKDAVTCN
jgi:two-component system chemotaxis sensor kinase CheA